MTRAAQRPSIRMLAPAFAVAFALGACAATAHAEDRRGHEDHDRGWHGDHRGYAGGYYPAPPVAYGGPYYPPPPVVYAPGIGINLPGVSIGIH